MALGIAFSLSVILQLSQDYPSKPVHMIEPFGAGGGPDLLSRALSPSYRSFGANPLQSRIIPAQGVQRPPPWLRSHPLTVTRCS